MDDHHISKHIIFFTGENLPKIEGFQSPKGREKTRKKSQKNYVWFSVM
jgi:hypothetical protein